MLLRMALVNALTYRPNETAQYPTIAGERVFDTRLVPVQLTEDKVEVPIITVYALDTRTGEGNKDKSARFTGVNYIQTFEIEIQVATYEKVLLDPKDKKKGHKTVQTIAENDAGLAAVLDMFESQVWRVLHDGLNPWSAFWARGVRNAKKYSSELEADGEKNNRYALRRISLEIETCVDPLPKTGVTTGTVPVYPPPLTADDLVLFEGTYLEDVVKLMLGQPDTATIMDAIRSTLGGDSSILLPALRRIGVTVRGKPIEQEPAGQILAKQEMQLPGETDG